MKKFAKCFILTIGLTIMLLLSGCSKNTFAEIVDTEVFQTVPLMAGENIQFSEAEDVGSGNYLIWAYDTTLDEYKGYLKVLEEDGFTKYTDNGEEGIEGYVYTAHYQKDDLLVVVTHLSKDGSTMINACQGAELSENLIYKEEYVANNIEGAKTTLTMPELYRAGNSFVFQLKNGHFIINDGGEQNDAPYLLDYLESMAPNGEKPIVDAWIISHAHTDHMGPFMVFAEKEKMCNRIYVEQVLFTEASEAAHADRGANDRTDALTFYTKTVPSRFKTSTGETTKLYRMREGERYYFSDITMDVIYAQDMVEHEEWRTWNATSTVVNYTVEGQKVLLTADTDYECQMMLLDVFDDDYFDLTVYQAPHHGGNVYNVFSKHLKSVTTVLYPSYDVNRSINVLLGRYTQNSYLKSMSDEALGFLEGGVRLTFPYESGTYERLPMTEWKYDKKLPARLQK